MKFLDSVRQKARFCREKIFISPANLLERVEEFIKNTHEIELTPCHKDFIDGGKAELRPMEGLIYYDEELNNNLAEKLWVILHELGHLEQHGARLTKLSCHPDPIYNEIYGLAGKDSLARYNPKSLEEVEANTFAAEFLCPSDKAFQLWLSNPEITLNEIAAHFGAPIFIVRSQLAGALHEIAFEDKKEPEEVQILELFDNPKQDEAAKWLSSPALVDAGPGTGKTATLIKRIEFLLTKFPDDASNILVLTFSNEACTELYERIASKFDDAIASQIEISTFHGFGLSLIQKHGHRNNLDLNTCVLDETGQKELLNEVLGELHDLKVLKVSKPDETVKEASRHISFLKERMLTPDLFEEKINKMSSEEAVKKENAQDLLKIFKAYEKLKDSRNKLDFADLIQKSVDIFDRNSDVVTINRKKYKWVLVDEYQDVSRATAILLQSLCGKENPPWVVGDKRQSIFRFCGANPENIDKFNEDFPNAKKFTLNMNYRSAEPLVKNKNKLANLMENEAGTSKEIWKPSPKNPKSKVNPPVTFAIAESDESERNGVVGQIQSWVKQKVEIKDVAVLARRNEDVRNIVLALTKRHIPAVASGIVTAEGNAGDLANIITLGDNPIPSIPRLVYCLKRDNHTKKDLDKLIARLIESFRENKELSIDNDANTSELSQQISKIYKSFTEEKFASDAFSIICVFLFEASNYLRNILNLSNEIEKSLALNEIVTTLTQAATYRFSHQGDKPHISPHISRKNFAKYFRESLSQSNTPTTSPPSQLNADAVKVMTCHASKGLEFPYVIVTGQTLSGMIGKRGEYKWLPQALAPKIDDDIEQANSTLFVAMSRAKQGLAVSYSKTSIGLENAKQRKIVPLLQNWRDAINITEDEWNSFEVVEKEFFETGKIWGGNIKYPIASRKLDKGSCSLSIYLQDGLGLKFPLAERPFYPSFYVAVRMILRSIVTKAFENQRALNVQEAMTILQAFWNFEDFHIDKDHSHHNLYWNLAQRYVKGFINSFTPETGNAKFINLIIENNGREIELDLACAYCLDDGSTKAIFFRSESLKEKLSKKNDSLLWSGIKDSHRNAFVLLRERFPNLQLKVYSGTDAKLYNFQWAKENFIIGQETKIKEKSEDLLNEKFTGEIVENTCNYRCENRINCPHWIGALN